MDHGQIYAYFRPEERLESVVAADEEPGEDKDWEEAIVCAACSFFITWKREKIRVHGKHAHVFFNPAGIVFELGCFQNAPGCVPLGRGTQEFTWFDGYAWRICVCGRCQNHLGWHYHSEQGGGNFFGLILSRLQEKQRSG